MSKILNHLYQVVLRAYGTFSNSDFLKMFDIVEEDNKDTVKPSVLKLTCKGIKTTTLQGFYQHPEQLRSPISFIDPTQDQYQLLMGHRRLLSYEG